MFDIEKRAKTSPGAVPGFKSHHQLLFSSKFKSSNLRQFSIVVEPLLRHLGDEQRRLFDLLPGHDESGVGDAHVQPLPQDQLLVTKLGITQKLKEI